MKKFKVYYDSKCIVCSREIDFYRRKPGADAIEWIDITAHGFDAQSEGLDPVEVRTVFHVRDEGGRLMVGVDGFIEIWRRLPSLARWVQLAKLPGARVLLKSGYWAFVRVRPFLPRRAEDCHDGYCQRK